MQFNPDNYGPVVGALVDSERLCQLGPGRPNRSVYERLQALRPADLFECPVVDTSMARACLAGLWLWHDYLDESHTISQEIEHASGSYWHGIMHRREPDYSNAKYWFRRVGAHPIFGPLNELAKTVAVQHPPDAPAQYLTDQADWDPFRFVDLCQQVACGHANAEQLCREIARGEWQLLFDYCYQQAIGKQPR